MEFVVHEALLCHFSPFFYAAFRGAADFKERSTLTVKLPTADEQSFHFLIQWLYGAREKGRANKLTFWVGQNLRTLTILETAKLFQLALFLQCDLLTDSLSKEVWLAHEIWLEGSCKVDLKTVEYVYENFTSGSGFREAVVKVFSAGNYLNKLDHHAMHDYPQAFIWDVAVERHKAVTSLQDELKTVREKLKRSR